MTPRRPCFYCAGTDCPNYRHNPSNRGRYYGTCARPAGYLCRERRERRARPAGYLCRERRERRARPRRTMRRGTR